MAFGRRIALMLALAAVLLRAGEARAQILSAKRGFADTGASYNNLQATGAGWYYTWGTGAASPGTFDASFYPMFWNAPSQATINSVVARNPTYVLGFNEPERTDQANMTVAQAITSWTTISNSFAGTSIKLVSPSVADTGGTTGGQQWLSSFMSQATAAGLKVDAVSFHWYGVSTPTDPAGAASSFLSRVDSYHNSYGLPVFITEFAIHDWGGVYTDAQIIEANREFLNIVIPGLESRSYVAGYAWYNWFTDSPLYTTSGSTLTPTSMSYAYIGAMGVGTTTDISGQNLGEHVAELTGGNLTMTGAAGTIKYIDALTGESGVGGTTNWALAGTGNWVRIQPGATLSKTGTNQVTFSSGTITDNGVLEVSAGTLVLGSTVSGSGTARVSGGTLTLTGNGSLSGMPLIDVRPGGTLNVAGLSGGAIVITSGRTLNMDGSATGNVVGSTGSTISGGGTFGGNLTAGSGATVRVGKDGSGVASRVIIDNFASYATGPVATVAAGVWTANAGTTEAAIESLSGNNVLSFGSATTAFIGVSRNLPAGTALGSGATATYFFRVNSATDTPNHAVGLGDQASTGTVDFSDFEAQFRLKQGSSGTFAVDARNGAAFTATLASGLALNTWYNVWLVINNATDKYDVYMNTGTGAATAANKLNGSQLSFRNGTNQALDYFLAYAGAAPVANGVHLDDLTYQAGVDLTNPSVNFNPGLTWTAETMNVTGNYVQNSGGTLQMNLLTPAVHDVLHVTGSANFSGTLAITYATGAPVPKIGDVFQLVNAGGYAGAFTTVQLPALSGTLMWDSSLAAGNGRLSIFSGLLGDFNQDGVVNLADLTAAQGAVANMSAYESQYGLSDYGVKTFGDLTGDGAVTSADVQALAGVLGVPEPGTVGVVGVGVALLMGRRRRGREGT